MDKTLQERVSWLLEKSGLTLEEFGRLVGMRGRGKAYGRSNISKIASGNNENPSPEFFTGVVSVLGVRREWLEHGDGEPGVDGETIRKRITYQIARNALPYSASHLIGAGLSVGSGFPTALDDEALLQMISRRIVDQAIAIEDRIKFAQAGLEILRKQNARTFSSRSNPEHEDALDEAEETDSAQESRRSPRVGGTSGQTGATSGGVSPESKEQPGAPGKAPK